MAKKELICPYCGKEGFKAQAALKSHIGAKHPTQQVAPPGKSQEVDRTIEFTVPTEVPPGVHTVPVRVYVKEDGTIGQTSEIPKPPSSSERPARKNKVRRNALPFVIKERYKMRRREDGSFKNTVAMMGTHGKTAPEMPWYEEGIKERWLLNDSHGIDYVKHHVEEGRVDRWWQMHHRWRITRRATRHASDHWQWLQDVKTVPRIVTQRHFADIPNSEGFKLREITELLLGNKLGRGAGYAQVYYTNTFSYMFAQVLYEKMMGIIDWERVELYGCELEQFETEYYRQRPGLEFWFGMCVREGIEIYVPESCFMLYAQDTVTHPSGQSQLIQYPGYMAYGYKSPSLEELKARNEAYRQQGVQQQESVGVDPVEENVMGAWEDYYRDHIFAYNEGLAWIVRANDLSEFGSDEAKLTEWMDSLE